MSKIRVFVYTVRYIFSSMLISAIKLGWLINDYKNLMDHYLVEKEKFPKDNFADFYKRGATRTVEKMIGIIAYENKKSHIRGDIITFGANMHLDEYGIHHINNIKES